MKDSPIPIIIILFILLGLAYSPLKEQKDNPQKSGTQASSLSQNSGSSNKVASEGVKTLEIDVKRLEQNIEKTIAESKRSPYYEKIRVSGLIGQNNPDPNKEYFTLSTSLDKDETVNITGWYLKSEVTGYSVVIGKASLLPFPFTKTENDVVLGRGDRAIVTKGFSPIGISFRTNKCTGYFEENRTFSPSLPRQCPRPADEDLPKFSSVYDRQDECLDLLERIPRCTTVGNEYLRDLPDTVPQSCKNYMVAHINYNACVAKHFGDTDFPGREYRIYLGKFGPLWRPEREKINLHDRSGLIVDTITY